MKQLKVKVTKKFLDRYAGIYRNEGDTLTISEERYREIKRSGDYIEVVKDKKPETKATAEKKN